MEKMITAKQAKEIPDSEAVQLGIKREMKIIIDTFILKINKRIIGYAQLGKTLLETSLYMSLSENQLNTNVVLHTVLTLKDHYENLGYLVHISSSPDEGNKYNVRLNVYLDWTNPK
jgi:hypothetical protein